MPFYNDIDLKKWKEYSNIETDSLWLIDKRDNSSSHSGHYHGNFVPQIPRQLFSRYTKQGEWILDPFMGSGTSLIEASRMGRNSVGIELQINVAKEAAARIAVANSERCEAKIFTGDSRRICVETILASAGIKNFQFIIMHPPYWDIIKFSDSPDDLSNASTLDNFISSFGEVIDNLLPYLEHKRYCAVVVGDKYSNGQVIPLGFHSMNLFISKGLTLKAVLVKNIGETKGKSGRQGIWRYRALASDFYIFKHEYIFVFKKEK